MHQVVRDDGEVGAVLRGVLSARGRSRRRRHEVVRGAPLGWTRQERGDVEGARASFEESLLLREGAGFLPGVGAAALALAEFEAEQGRPQRARKLLAQAREVFERVGMERFLGFGDEVERGLQG